LTDKKDELSAQAANKIAKLIREKKNANLGLPTGNTPILMYKHLVELTKQQGLDWSAVQCFALDEYIHSSTEHLFQTYLETNFFF